MKIEVVLLLLCVSASFAVEIGDVKTVNAVEKNESLKSLNRRPRLIGIGDLGGIGIVGGIGIIGGGVKGLGAPGSKNTKRIELLLAIINQISYQIHS